MKTAVTDRRRHGEDGIALFYALLVTLVVAGIVAVVFATAISEQRQAAFEIDFEDTIHIAEAGAEIYLGDLVDDNSTNSGIPGPDALSQDAAQWAIDTAVSQTGATYDFPAVAISGGETVALRPEGEDAEFVYGVGFTPSRDAYVAGVGEAYARVVRVQVAFSPNTFDPQHAMLTGGNLRLAGNYKIEGSTGAVHTNGAIEVIGTTGTASGGITFSGSCNAGCDKASGPVEPEKINAVTLRAFWDEGAALEITGDGDWYEYCAGSWFRRTLKQTDPCDGFGEPVDATDSDIEPWTGLNYDNPALPTSAVYYIPDDLNVDIKKPTGDLTVLTAGDISIGPSANTNPPDARYPGWYLFAEGSITIGGNATSGTFETVNAAAVWANETIELKGTIETNQIAFVGVDEARLGSGYSGGGNGRVRFNGDASMIIPGEKVPLVVQWDEVFAP